MNPTLVDFHCHLDLFPDPVGAVSAAEIAEIYTLAVTTTPRAWPRNHELTHKTKYVRAALGLHPQVVAERAGEIELWEEYLPQARYVGEVGLDAGPQHCSSFDLQKQVFTRVLKRCSEVGGRILSVHSVRSAQVVLDLIESHLPRDRGHVVLHWFTGPKSLLRRTVDLGCYFSVNAAMLTKDRGRDLISAIPDDRLLTETDAPFTSTHGRPSTPGDVAITVENLAALRHEDVNVLAQTIRSNLRSMLKGSNNGRPEHG
jgi:TatD DNase family protein